MEFGKHSSDFAPFSDILYQTIKHWIQNLSDRLGDSEVRVKCKKLVQVLQFAAVISLFQVGATMNLKLFSLCGMQLI